MFLAEEQRFEGPDPGSWFGVEQADEDTAGADSGGRKEEKTKSYVVRLVQN